MCDTLPTLDLRIKMAADIVVRIFGLEEALARARRLEHCATNKRFAGAVLAELERRAASATTWQ